MDKLVLVACNLHASCSHTPFIPLYKETSLAGGEVEREMKKEKLRLKKPKQSNAKSEEEAGKGVGFQRVSSGVTAI